MKKVVLFLVRTSVRLPLPRSGFVKLWTPIGRKLRIWRANLPFLVYTLHLKVVHVESGFKGVKRLNFAVINNICVIFVTSKLCLKFSQFIYSINYITNFVANLCIFYRNII